MIADQVLTQQQLEEDIAEVRPPKGFNKKVTIKNYYILVVELFYFPGSKNS